MIEAAVPARGRWVIEAQVIRADGTREPNRIIGTVTSPAPDPIPASPSASD